MHAINIQFIADKALAPKKSSLLQWAKKALAKQSEPIELTIRIVDLNEMTELNSTYRGKKKPTNVLSFPFSSPPGITLDIPILGDIVICAPIVNQEAIDQHKSQASHWAHMIIHGILHLQGYDHETDDEATLMETQEIETMKMLGFSNPYESGDNIKYHD